MREQGRNPNGNPKKNARHFILIAIIRIFMTCPKDTG